MSSFPLFSSIPLKNRYSSGCYGHWNNVVDGAVDSGDGSKRKIDLCSHMDGQSACRATAATGARASSLSSSWFHPKPETASGRSRLCFALHLPDIRYQTRWRRCRTAAWQKVVVWSFFVSLLVEYFRAYLRSATFLLVRFGTYLLILWCMLIIFQFSSSGLLVRLFMCVICGVQHNKYSYISVGSTAAFFPHYLKSQ